MAQLPTPGGDDGNWGTILNDYLQVEHNSDGTHKTSYLPLAGGTMTGDLVNPNLVNHTEEVVSAKSGSSYALDLTTGNVFNITLTDNCTFTVTNIPASGTACSITLILTQDGTGSRSVTWPSNTKWSSGLSPALFTSAAAIDIFQLFSINGGTTWYGFQSGIGMA